MPGIVPYHLDYPVNYIVIPSVQCKVFNKLMLIKGNRNRPSDDQVNIVSAHEL